MKIINIIKKESFFIISLLIICGSILLLEKFVFINARIPSESMENTLLVGDLVLGNRLAYNKSNPVRGDIIIFNNPNNKEEQYIKRVIGIPGDNILIEDGLVYINGELLKENYLKDKAIIDKKTYEYIVPDNSYFVLGDNRNNSKDSRYWDNPFVNKEDILGKANIVYFRNKFVFIII